jgi:hypothetical protein
MLKTSCILIFGILVAASFNVNAQTTQEIYPQQAQEEDAQIYPPSNDIASDSVLKIEWPGTVDKYSALVNYHSDALKLVIWFCKDDRDASCTIIKSTEKFEIPNKSGQVQLTPLSLELKGEELIELSKHLRGASSLANLVILTEDAYGKLRSKKIRFADLDNGKMVRVEITHSKGLFFSRMTTTTDVNLQLIKN